MLLFLNLALDLLYLWGISTRLRTSVCDLTYGKEWCSREKIREAAYNDAFFWFDVFSVLPLLVQPLPPLLTVFGWGGAGVGSWSWWGKAVESLKVGGGGGERMRIV